MKNSLFSIVAIVIVICFMKFISNKIELQRSEKCRLLPHTIIMGNLYCKTLETTWEKYLDIEQKRKELFEKARQGNRKAKKELNKLNYEEELRNNNGKT